MAHKEVEDAVEKLLEPILEADGIEVVDVEYVRERNWILRIFIDKEGGVDLNDCQVISEKAGAIRTITCWKFPRRVLTAY